MENDQAQQANHVDSIGRGEPDVQAAQRSVAFVMSPALGDTLNLLIVAHNLRRAGWRVDVFGDHAHALAAWFAHLSIAPALKADDAPRMLMRYPVVIQMHRDRPLAQLRDWHAGFIDLHEVEYGKNADCMAKRFADFAAARFKLADVVISNGMRPPGDLTFRKHASRVAMHPEASTPDKRWLPDRFVQLSRRLEAAGMQVELIVEDRERSRWESLGCALPPLRSFASTALLAEWLYESGWFIGNDSGVGHLASSLGLPTLTIFRRRGVAQRWRPGFATGDIMLPSWWLPTAGLKERWWRESITVGRVLKAFFALRTRVTRKWIRHETS
ncbi:glycosyltransferase family 9 protein [Paraburkholderia sp.]|uniref:glycosyltransferase family 9 protein n=1 Tax=Paraburkholderia sp. TaxID=1926495 RepID=UPI002F41B7FB